MIGNELSALSIPGALVSPTEHSSLSSSLHKIRLGEAALPHGHTQLSPEHFMKLQTHNPAQSALAAGPAFLRNLLSPHYQPIIIHESPLLELPGAASGAPRPRLALLRLLAAPL